MTKVALDTFPSREAFLTWLGEHSPNSVVGQVGADADCPLARFLSRSLGQDVVIGFTSVLLGPYPHAEIVLPFWAVRFVHAVDEEAECEITAERAIEILCEAEG